MSWTHPKELNWHLKYPTQFILFHLHKEKYFDGPGNIMQYYYDFALDKECRINKANDKKLKNKNWGSAKLERPMYNKSMQSF